MPTRIEVFDSPPALAHAAALHIAGVVADTLEQQSWCHLALPGGPFVRPIYTELVQIQLPWSQVMFFFTDERCVPVTHPASNFGEAIDKFLKNPRIDLHQFQRIEGEEPDHELAAEEYARTLPDEFDLVLAELGVDGHIAALYPDSPAMLERERQVVPVLAPTRPTQRISMTPKVLSSARNSLVVANLELQVPSPVLPRLLQLAAFADAGRLWNRGAGGTTRALADDRPSIKVTPGVGVRIVSPFGAIRVDLGYNPYRLPSGAAYFNAPLQGGVAPLYCVSPGNTLPVRSAVGVNAPPTQDAGTCPSSFRPVRGTAFLRRLNPSIWIGQAF